MSTQYGTLSHRRTVQVPMWLIVVLVVGVAAIGIGYTVDRYESRGAVSTSTVGAVNGTQVAAGGVAAAQHAGTVFPGGLETSGVIPTTVEAPAAVFPGGLETSGIVPTAGKGDVESSGASQPIVINGGICHQCR